MSVPERSFSVVLQDIVRNIQDILRSEIRLAKTGVREELAKTQAASLLVAIGGVSTMFCAFFLLLTAFHALSLVMPPWAAALCVAGAVGLVAVFAIMSGLKRFKTINATAPKTVASVKENVAWAKQHLK